MMDICYCFPAGNHHYAAAYRFLNSYLTYPPMTEHRLVLLCDAANVDEARELFAIVPGVVAQPTPDHALDLSRYEAYAQTCGADAMMMLGGSSYCKRTGWGLRAMAAFQQLGSNAIYGACGNTGAPGVHKHIRTTGWWAAPSLLRKYPYWPQNAAGRYQAEHGERCLSWWVTAQGGTNWVVTFNGIYPLEQANDDAEGYARGIGTSMIMGDRLS